jgi:AcrR family transcriptional regulator
MKKAILEARQEVSRQQILDTAKRLFAEHGVRATSLSKLADALGITKAGLYYYFDSKQSLVIETVRQNVAEFRADVMAPLPDDLDVTAMLRARLDRKLQRTEEHGALDMRFFYTVMLEALDEPEIEAEFEAFWGDSETELARWIRQGQAEGRYRPDVDVDATITALSGATIGTDLLWLNSPERIDLRAVYALLVEQLITTLTTPTPTEAP